MRRDRPPKCHEVSLLEESIARGDVVLLTGTIPQEVLQGFFVEKLFRDLERRLRAFALLELVRADYVLAGGFEFIRASRSRA